MNCSKAQKLLYLYSGNDLSKRKMNRLKNHLSNCQTCAAELNKIQKSLEIAAQTFDPQQNEIQTEQMWQNIQNEIKPAREVQTQTKYALFVEKSLSFVSDIVDYFKHKPLNIKLGFATSALVFFCSNFSISDTTSRKGDNHIC